MRHFVSPFDLVINVNDRTETLGASSNADTATVWRAMSSWRSPTGGRHEDIVRLYAAYAAPREP